MSETLSLSRDLYVPRELVFDAWTLSEHVAQWYAPEDCRIGEVVVEPAVGGRFELTWTDAAGVTVCEAGVFVEIANPAGFVCLMRAAQGGDPRRGGRVRLELSDLVDACRIELGWDELPAGGQETLRQTWEDRLDRLEKYFAVI
jgi:uncharacterized protein YndB with AHSA1/START domain